MSVSIFLTVTKDEVEVLGQALEMVLDENLKGFIEKVLKETQKEADDLVNRGKALTSVNPFSMV